MPLPPPPTIQSLTPSSGQVGTAFRLDGDNFTSSAFGTVFVDSLTAFVSVWEQHEIVATIPSFPSTGTRAISVQTAAGQVSTGTIAFNVNSTIAITSTGPPPPPQVAMGTITVHAIRIGDVEFTDNIPSPGIMTLLVTDVSAVRFGSIIQPSNSNNPNEPHGQAVIDLSNGLRVEVSEDFPTVQTMLFSNNWGL